MKILSNFQLLAQRIKFSDTQKIKDFLSPKMLLHFQAFNSYELKSLKGKAS